MEKRELFGEPADGTAIVAAGKTDPLLRPLQIGRLILRKR